MMIRSLRFMLPVLACLLSCAPAENPSQSSGAGAASGSQALAPWTAQDRSDFYHLGEGSELIPLSWLKAVRNPDDTAPFLDKIERFGLIADPTNKDGLPIGLTAELTRDLRFSGIRMVGVNCAACHTTKLRYQGNEIVIDGAPSRFDLLGFFGELSNALKKTAADSRRIVRFLYDLNAVRPEVAGTGMEGRAGLFRIYRSPAAIREEGNFGRDVAVGIEQVVRAEKEVEPFDLAQGFGTDEGKNELERFLQRQTVAPAVTGEIPPTAQYRVFGSDAQIRGNVTRSFSDLAATIRLLYARAKFILTLGKGSEAAKTDGGFGRVDAFGSVRNNLYPSDPVELTAPVSYPHLWGFPDVRWLHWDGNTTSVLERNIGQAIGLGAIVELSRFNSTVQVRNIHRLDQLAARIPAPKWSEAIFGALDPAKVVEGEKVFQDTCRECHETEHGKPTETLHSVGTDDERADRFAEPLGGKPFHEVLAALLRKVKARGFVLEKVNAQEQRQMEGDRFPAEYRTTRRYTTRPLRSVWATAPYLHNDSVPTLWHLLNPASRPKKFSIGATPEYDPKNVGLLFKTINLDATAFDTAKRGNANGGHAFGAELSKEKKESLLEYLKSL